MPTEKGDRNRDRTVAVHSAVKTGVLQKRIV